MAGTGGITGITGRVESLEWLRAWRGEHGSPKFRARTIFTSTHTHVSTRSHASTHTCCAGGSSQLMGCVVCSTARACVGGMLAHVTVRHHNAMPVTLHLLAIALHEPNLGYRGALALRPGCKIANSPSWC